MRTPEPGPRHVWNVGAALGALPARRGRLSQVGSTLLKCPCRQMGKLRLGPTPQRSGQGALTDNRVSTAGRAGVKVGVVPIQSCPSPGWRPAPLSWPPSLLASTTDPSTGLSLHLALGLRRAGFAHPRPVPPRHALLLGQQPVSQPRCLRGAGSGPGRAGPPRALKSSLGPPRALPPRLPTMAETAKLQLFVKVPGRLGWGGLQKGCSARLCFPG